MSDHPVHPWIEHPPARVVFLFDVDGVLLDNDRFEADLTAHLRQAFGAEDDETYWKLFERERHRVGYADYLGALQEYRRLVPQDSRLLELSSFVLDYPFADRLYPGALEVLARMRAHGPTAILSDGDVILQPRKIERSGLAEAVERRVLIYVHKTKELDHVAACLPAEHYVMVDDKVHLLAEFKRAWGGRVTTVFPRQGHYAHDPKLLAHNPPPDLTLEHVDDLLQSDVEGLISAGQVAATGD